MKKILYAALLAALFCLLPTESSAQARFGALRYDSILVSMPEYAGAQMQLRQLREKYEAEAGYNEQEFRRMFSDFLQGQKEFPQNILLKRQRDLQSAMEKGLAFRHEADSLLRAAEADMLAPVHALLASAVNAVGIERGYEAVVDRDGHNVPFLNPAVTEDATPFVLSKLTQLRAH